MEKIGRIIPVLRILNARPKDLLERISLEMRGKFKIDHEIIPRRLEPSFCASDRDMEPYSRIFLCVFNLLVLDC